MAILYHEPWSLLRQFQNELNQGVNLFDGRASEPADGDNSNVVTSHWRPAVDIREEEDRFVIVADLPGVDPNDIEVTMDNGVLTLKGERKFEYQTGDDSYQRIERACGTFYRRFSLPDSANPEAIEAKGRNGVLEITLPKQEKIKPRRIEVQH